MLILIVEIIIFYIAGWLLIRHIASGGERRFLQKLFSLAYILKIILGIFLVLYLINRSENPYFNSDGELYDTYAISYAEKLRTGERDFVYPYTNLGPILLYTLIHYMFGSDPLVIVVVNVFLGSLTPVFTYYIASRLYAGHNIPKLASILTAFLPVTMIYNATHLKDGVVALIIVGLFLLLLKFKDTLRIKYTIFSLLLFACLFLYRDRLALMLLPFFICAYLITQFRHFSTKGALFLALYGAGGYFLYRFSSQITVLLFSLDKAAVFDRGGALGRDWWQTLEFSSSGSISSIFYNLNPIQLMFIAPVGTLYAMLIPFPLWILKPGSYFQFNLISLSSIAWYLLLPFVCYGLWISLRRGTNWHRIMGILCLGGLVGMAITVSGLMSSGRHREPFIPFFMIMSAVGIYHSLRQRKIYFIYGSYLLIAGIAFSLYIWGFGG